MNKRFDIDEVRQAAAVVAEAAADDIDPLAASKPVNPLEPRSVSFSNYMKPSVRALLDQLVVAESIKAGRPLKLADVLEMAIKERATQHSLN